MIKSFKHKGLKQFYDCGDIRRINPVHRNKLRLRLAALDSAMTLFDMDIPGYRLHALRGTRSGFWAISVSGNWRLTFRFTDGNVYDVDYEDYH